MERRKVILIFVLAIIIRLLLVGFPGHNYDMDSFSKWSEKASFVGISQVYDTDPDAYYYTNYPPVYFSILGVLGRVNNSLFHFDFFSPEFQTTIKLVNSSLDIFCGVVLLFILKKLNVVEKKRSIILAVWLLNPVILITSTVWGQIDNFLFLFFLLAIYSMLHKQAYLTGVFLTLAILTKTQALVFLPVFAIYLLFKYKWQFSVRVGLSSLISGVFLIIPFISSGTWNLLLNVYTSAADRYPYLNMNAYNIWWFGTDSFNLSAKSDSIEVFPFISAKLLGLIIFAVFYAAILYFLVRKLSFEKFVSALSLVAVIFYMLPTQMHERYMFLFFGFFLLVPAFFNKLWSIYSLLSFSICINLLNAAFMSYIPFLGNIYPVSSYILTVVNVVCLSLLATTYFLDKKRGTI